MTERPPWARWRATDADGEEHWFECRPRWNKALGRWTSKGSSEPLRDSAERAEHPLRRDVE